MKTILVALVVILTMKMHSLLSSRGVTIAMEHAISQHWPQFWLKTDFMLVVKVFSKPIKAVSKPIIIP